MLPESKPSAESVGIVSDSATRRNLFQLLDIASAQNHVVRFESGDHASYYVSDVASPLFLAVLFQSIESYIGLVRSLFVREMSEFHRLHDAIDDKGRTEPCAQAQKQHLAAFVTSQGLHGRVVNDLNRMPECSAEIKPHPAGSQIMRFGNRPIVQDRPGIAKRNHVIFPGSDDPLDAGDHLLRRHLWTRRKLSRRVLPRGKDLHMSSANIYHQHFHDKASSPSTHCLQLPAPH